MLPDRWITDWHPSARFPVYTRANAAEVLPEPASPLGWTLVWEQGVVQGWRDAAVEFGVFDADELDPVHPEVVGSFGGYFYVNAVAARLLGVRAPGLDADTIDRMFFGAEAAAMPHRPGTGDDRPASTARLGESLDRVLGAVSLAEVRIEQELADGARRDRPDLLRLTEAELVARSRALVPLVRRVFQRHLVVTAASTIGPWKLDHLAADLAEPGLVVRLLAGLGDTDAAAPTLAMWDLSRLVAASPELSGEFDAGVEGLPARVAALRTPEAGGFLSAFDAFLERYGSRGPNEWDLRGRTWELRPELALAAVDRMRLTFDQESPRARHDRLAMEREDATEWTRSALAHRPADRDAFETALRSAHLFLRGRERTKAAIIKVIHEIRMATWELGRRAHEAGYLARGEQVTMLRADELEEFVAGPDALGAVLADRERVYRQLFDLAPPAVVDGTVAPLSAWPRRERRQGPRLGAGEVLQGSPGCAGRATGRARVVTDPSDPSALEPGDVLVAPSTDPAWTPLFVPAAAVVVDVGALSSHAVVVSRELGIPCVVAASDATVRIPDGALVRVDGSAGTVTVVET